MDPERSVFEADDNASKGGLERSDGEVLLQRPHLVGDHRLEEGDALVVAVEGSEEGGVALEVRSRVGGVRGGDGEVGRGGRGERERAGAERRAKRAPARASPGRAERRTVAFGVIHIVGRRGPRRLARRARDDAAPVAPPPRARRREVRRPRGRARHRTRHSHRPSRGVDLHPGSDARASWQRLVGSFRAASRRARRCRRRIELFLKTRTRPNDVRRAAVGAQPPSLPFRHARSSDPDAAFAREVLFTATRISALPAGRNTARRRSRPRPP